MKKGFLFPIILSVLFIFGGFSTLLEDIGGQDIGNRATTRDQIAHSPISINGNSDLTSTASSEGWSGTGTVIDPIIIKGYRIIATGDFGIAISNTDLYLVIDDCNITNSDQANIIISNSKNAIVRECILYYNKVDAIRLSGSSDCSIENNTMDADDVITIGRNGIRLIDSTSNIVKDNQIARMVNDGIMLVGSSSLNRIHDNSIEQANNNAILIDSDNNLVSNNLAFNCGWGVRIEGDENTIRENFVRRNGYGIYISQGDLNLVQGNVANRNFIGINVVVCMNNEIIGNYIGKSASYGIDLYTNSGSYNVVHSNHLYYNNLTDGSYDPERIQARDLNPGNIWYDDSTDRGNFWFDWRGNDNDDDGIVDLSYPIEGGGGRDLYPILNPSIPDAFIPPWGLRASPQPTYIDIDWYAPFYGPGVNVIAYDIYRSERGGGELYLTSVTGGHTTYRDTDVISGRAYWYYVVALNDIAYSNQSGRIKSSPDTQGPNIKIDSPEEGDIFDTTSIRVTYTGTDNIAVDRYEISLDGGKTIDKGLWENITFIGLEEGDHTISVTVYDLAEHSRTATASFIVDVSDPFIRIDAPDDRIILTNLVSPTIHWTSYDIVTYINGFHVSLDGAPYSLIGGLTQLKLNELPSGDHTISIMAVDGAGNENNDTVNLTIDPDPPSLSIIQPDHFYVNNTGELNVRWYGTDPISGIERYLIRWGLEDWYDVGLSRSYNIRGLSEGTHHVYVRASDRAGNNVTEERMVIVDLSPPDMDILFPVEGGRYSEEFNVEWDASDILTGIQGVTLILDGQEGRDFRSDEPITLGFGTDGEHTIELWVRDGAGNSVKMTRSFFFDVSQPIVDSITPSSKNNIPVDTTISIGFTEMVNQSSIKIDISDVEGNYSWDGNNLTFTPLETLDHNTKYTLRITGEDLAGNPLVPFDWYFITEIDIMLAYGKITGRVIDTLGDPVPNATIWFKTGEKTTSGTDGYFNITLPEGVTYLVISIEGYGETKYDLNVKGGLDLDLGELPIRLLKDDKNEDDGGKDKWIIIVIIAVIIIILFLAMVAWQVKKTMDYSKMPAIPDEWTNNTQAIRPKNKLDDADLESLSRLKE